MPSSDNKEHHFCFAYKGERLRITPFEGLHFQNVQGTSTLDGIQLVRVSLHKKNGRRASTIPKIIQEYNQRSGTDPVIPVKVPGVPQAISCFKIAQVAESNPILLRIDMDRSSSRYWSWDCPPPLATTAPTKQSKKGATTKEPKKKSFAGLEGLVRELNLDPATLCMQSAYDHVSKAYFQVKGIELKNSGTFPLHDREFILAELKRHFDRECMFIVAPATPQKPLSSAAKAIVQDETLLMDDFRFKSQDSTASQIGAPNQTALRFFQGMLPQWREQPTARMTLKEIVSVFNQDCTGIYRQTCVIPFMQPFIQSGSVERLDELTLQIHVARVAEQIKKYT